MSPAAEIHVALDVYMKDPDGERIPLVTGTTFLVTDLRDNLRVWVIGDPDDPQSGLPPFNELDRPLQENFLARMNNTVRRIMPGSNDRLVASTKTIELAYDDEFTIVFAVEVKLIG